MSEEQRCLIDHSSFLRSSHEMFRYDVNQTLHDYLKSRFDVMHERTVAFWLCFYKPGRDGWRIIAQSASPIVS